MDWQTVLDAAGEVALQGVLFRLVESQEQVATMQLVNSLQRQAILEDLLETTKPIWRRGSEHLHYLLATPFRYPPLAHGSRFGARTEPSLFYGSLQPQTVLAETAYYRFVFWFGMKQPPQEKLCTQHTLFEARYHTKQGVQLHQPPFAEYRATLTHPSSYAATQQLGALMRQRGVQLFEFESARDTQHGINIALFVPEAFAHSKPVSQEMWFCELDGEKVQFYSAQTKQIIHYALADFLVEGVLPQPA